MGKLRISPVLLQKGATNVALYGLRNLRDGPAHSRAPSGVPLR